MRTCRVVGYLKAKGICLGWQQSLFFLLLDKTCFLHTCPTCSELLSDVSCREVTCSYTADQLDWIHFCNMVSQFNLCTYTLYYLTFEWGLLAWPDRLVHHRVLDLGRTTCLYWNRDRDRDRGRFIDLEREIWRYWNDGDKKYRSKVEIEIQR